MLITAGFRYLQAKRQCKRAKDEKQLAKTESGMLRHQKSMMHMLRTSHGGAP